VNFVRRTVVLVALLGGGLVAAVPAAAQTGPHVSVNPATGPSGTVVTVTGSGFCASGCTPVTILLNGLVAQSNVAVSSGGSFTATATVDSGAGSIEVLATQTRSTQTIQAITYFENTPNVAAPPPTNAPHNAQSHPASPGIPASPTVTTTPPTTSDGSAQSPAAALAGASHADGGPSALVLALASLGGALVLGAGGFAAWRLARRRAAG
jgi:hypothetical protein